MNYLTQQLLNAEEINLINNALENETQNWEDGKKTAGSHATLVKNNLQLNRNSEVSKKYRYFYFFLAKNYRGTVLFLWYFYLIFLKMYCGTLICCGTLIRNRNGLFSSAGLRTLVFFQTGKLSCSPFHFFNIQS